MLTMCLPLAEAQQVGVPLEDRTENVTGAHPTLRISASATEVEAGQVVDLTATFTICASCSPNFIWRAPPGVGEFPSGSGSSVSWQAPAVNLPTRVFITCILQDGGGRAVAQRVGIDVRPAATSEFTVRALVRRGGYPLAGVTLAGLPGSPTTGADGVVEVAVPAGWTGTVVPTRSGYAFLPSSLQVGPVNGYTSLPTIDAARIRPGITFRFRTGDDVPVEGVRVNGMPVIHWSDETGEAFYTVNDGWSGTASYSKAGFDFSPPSTEFDEIAADRIVDVLANGRTYQVEGQISAVGGLGLPGVTLRGLPGDPETDSAGRYSATVPALWTGAVTPELEGFVFLPAVRGYELVGDSKLDHNYSALPVEIEISGRTGASGVLLEGFPQLVFSGAAGNFATTVPAGWSGTVTPRKAGASFSPPERSYDDVRSPLTGVDFSATFSGGKVWYVDSNEEFSRAKSLARPGDYVIVLPGVYGPAQNFVSAGVTWVSRDGPESTVLLVNGSIHGNAMDDSVVDGFTFEYSDPPSTVDLVRAVGKNFVLRRNIFHGNGLEPALWISSSSNVLIENNRFENARIGVLVRASTVSGQLSILNNHFELVGTGIDVGNNAELDVVIEANSLIRLDGAGTKAINLDGGRNVEVKSNLLQGWPEGIEIDDVVNGALIEHNSYVDNARAVDVGSVVVTSRDEVMLGCTRGLDTGSGSRVTVSHLMHWESSPFYGSGEFTWDEATIYEADPLFVDREGGDLRLDPLSPARGAASDGSALGALDQEPLYAGVLGDPTPTPALLDLLTAGPSEVQSQEAVRLNLSGEHAGGFASELNRVADWSSSDTVALDDQSNGVFRAGAGFGGTPHASVSFAGQEADHPVAIVAPGFELLTTTGSQGIVPGGRVHLTVDAENPNGHALEDCQLTIHLGSFLLGDTVPPHTSADASQVNWSIGELLPSGLSSVEADLWLPPEAPVGEAQSLQASASCGGVEYATSVTEVDVLGHPDVRVSLLTTDTSAMTGHELGLSFEVTSQGSLQAEDVVAQLQLPDGFSLVAAQPPPTSPNVWHLGDLAIGASWPIDARILVGPDPGAFVGALTALSSMGDIDLSDNSAAVTFDLEALTIVCPVVLQTLVIDSMTSFLSCDWISLTDVVVEAGGDLTLEAGSSVRLGDGFRVQSGGTFRVVINPDLLDP
jgi:hypothetical protein